MIKSVYPAWFEDFWKQALALKTRTLGSKPDAYKAAKLLKMGAEDVEMVIECFRRHTIRIKVNKDGFMPDHKDMCRWLRERRWEDEPEIVEYTEAVDVRSAVERRMSREWANQ